MLPEYGWQAANEEEQGQPTQEKKQPADEKEQEQPAQGREQPTDL